MRRHLFTTVMSSFIIRPANVDDVETLTRFNCQLSVETEGKSLDEATVRSGVMNGLRAGDEVQYFVADFEGNVIGQLMMTREWSDWRDGWMYWLQSVYVQVDYRNQGVFRSLLNAAQEFLQNRGDVACLRLYVEDENEPAMSAYRKLGFDFPGYRVMEMPITRSCSE